jgi:hypothetical protein
MARLHPVEPLGAVHRLLWLKGMEYLVALAALADWVPEKTACKSTHRWTDKAYRRACHLHSRKGHQETKIRLPVLNRLAARGL